MGKGRSLSALALALMLGAGAFGACTDHDPKVDRVGGPLPSYDGGDGGCSPEVAVAGARIPCEIDDILERKCRRCHTEPQQNGAPFPLITWADVNADYGGAPVFTYMSKAVKAGFMPYCAGGTCGNFNPIVEPLTADEKATLLAWLECPYPSFETTCTQ